jgi:hypothetical protein
METRKENKPVTRMTWYCDQVFASQGHQNISSRVFSSIVKQKELFTGTKMFP